MPGTAQSNGGRVLEKQVQAQFTHTHGTAYQRAIRFIQRNTQGSRQVTAVVLGKHLFTEDDVHTQLRPVETLLRRIIQQALAEQGVGAEYGLVKQRARLGEDGQRHVLTHTDIRHANRIGGKHHAHGQAIHQQGVALVDAKCLLQAKVNVVRCQMVLAAGAEAEGEIAATVARAGEHTGQRSGRQIVDQQLLHWKAFEKVGLG